jgi:hypothetical protein
LLIKEMQHFLNDGKLRELTKLFVFDYSFVPLTCQCCPL